jgi:acetyltransferase-like isoleucine patch superfamily enzyme
MHWRRRQRIRNALAHLGLPLSDRPVLSPGVEIGRHTFGYGGDTFHVYMEGARIDVGSFCSIHHEARVLAGSEHMMVRPSTFPFNARLFHPEKGNRGEAIDKGTTMIGNDVWIGIGAIVLSGVLVGDGAVIGAGAVVSKSIPAYAIVAGNPAQILRYRFDSATRRRLLALRWWDWDDEKIGAARELFMEDVGSFLEQVEGIHEARPESDLARRLREAPPDALTPHRQPDRDQSSVAEA